MQIKKATPNQHAGRAVLLFLILLFILSYINEYIIKPYGIWAYIALGLIEVISVSVTVFLYVKSNKIIPKPFFRLNPITTKMVGNLVLLGLCSQALGIFINMPIMILLSNVIELPTTELFAPSSPAELLAGVFVIGLVPAFFEEVLARGVILREYESYNTKTAIIMSAIYFGIMHNSLLKLPYTIFLGVILAVVVLRTGSIYSAMVLHLTNNVAALIQSYILQQVKPMGASIIIVILFIFYIVLAFGFVVMFLRFLKQTKCSYKSDSGTSTAKFGFSYSMLVVLCVYIAILVLQILNTNMGGLYL